jgi:hypothetical protein
VDRAYRTHLIVIGLYLLLALFLTWPLAAHLATHVPGEATWAFDESTFLWNMWWFKFSLLNLGQTPLASNYIFFPLGIRLTTYTFNLFNAALGLPVQVVFPLPLASNLVLLFSYISSAYGTFLLCLYLLAGFPGRRSLAIVSWAAFAAGAVFAFSASRMMYAALGHYNFVTIQWFPFYTLFLLKTLRQGGLKNVLLSGLFAALCLYAELTYSVFLLFLTLLVWLGEWLQQRQFPGRRQRGAGQPASGVLWSLLQPAGPAGWLLYTLAIGLVALLLASPFIVAVLPDFLDPAYQEPGWGEGLKLSADLVGLFTPTPLHPLSGVDWLAELRAVIEGTARFSDINTLFLGYGILGLALIGGLVWRAGRFWLWGALVFTILSLGPLLTINGRNRFSLDGLDVTFPLPFALLHYIPLINANRVPNRFGIPLTLCLALLVGAGVAWLLQRADQRISESASPKGRLRTQRVSESARHAIRNTQYASRFTFYVSRLTFHVSSLLLLILLLFDQYSVPLPLSDARIPEVYYQIGRESGDFTLLQLPLGWRNSYGTLGAERTQLQYYQAAHHRPILGGNTSRNPDFKFDYYAEIPLFAAITEAEMYRTVDDRTLERARQQAAELITLYNIKYLVIHEPLPHRKPYEDTHLAVRALALELIPHRPEPVYQSPGVQAFAVIEAGIAEPLSLDFGDWTSTPYRGEGWARNEEIFAATANWAIAPEAFIFFPVRGSGDRYLALQIAPFAYPGMPEQTVRLVINNHSLSDTFSLHEGWQMIETTLPEAYLKPGLNRLALRFAHTARPREVLPAQQTIGGSGLETPVDLEVNSSPGFAFITVGFGEEAVDASAHRRGINVAVVKPDSGEVLSAKGFDTAANVFEAEALRQFIDAIAPGMIVIVASQGPDAADFFTEDTLAALSSLGLNTDHLAAPFSAIGVKGAPAGTALQAAAGPEGTAYLRLGASSDTRDLAAAVDKIVIRKP